MDPLLINAIVGIIGVLAPIVANRFGWKVPGIIPPPPDLADKQATDFFDWAVKVDTGEIKLDPYDRAVLASTKPVFDRIMLKNAQPVPQTTPQFPATP